GTVRVRAAVTVTAIGGSVSAVSAGRFDQGSALIRAAGSGRPIANQPPAARTSAAPHPSSPVRSPARTLTAPPAAARPRRARRGTRQTRSRCTPAVLAATDHRRGPMFARFVDRPVLAAVISVLITLIGAVAG